jgi:hypothetical protein
MFVRGGFRGQCWRTHSVDLGPIEGASRMIEHRLVGYGDHDRAVLLNERQTFLIAVLNESRDARISAANKTSYPGRIWYVTAGIFCGASPRKTIFESSRSRDSLN